MGWVGPGPRRLCAPVSSEPDVTLLFSFVHTARSMGERLEAELTAAGLTAARFGVLDQLERAQGPLALGEIAARQSCVRSNMTQLIDRLEADGLVRRVADPADRRSVRAELTEAGRERHAAGRQVMDLAEARFNACVPAADRATLAQALAALGACLSDHS